MANGKIEFEGEGNPAERHDEPRYPVWPPEAEVTVQAAALVLSDSERQALQSVLHRETSCRPHYDGLRGLLSLSHAESEALLGLLRRL